MTECISEVLSRLLQEARLPAAVATTPMEGRGFDNEIVAATLTDGRRVVLRRWREPRTAEHARARFLAHHRLPAPAVLAADEQASLVEFVRGETLGDLIDAGEAVDDVWRRVGAAYRRVHDVAFPSGLTGEVLPDRIVLTPTDPVHVLHGQIDRAAPGLREVLPPAVPHLPALHEAVETAAESLRSAPTALGHGDINMWNILVSPDTVTLIDWDHPRVADPAMEVALLDKHASLFAANGLPAAFFDGYGRGPHEPNVPVHRIVQTLAWATGPDWAEIENDPALPDELKQRARRWRPVLVDFLRELPRRIRQVSAGDGA